MSMMADNQRKAAMMLICENNFALCNSNWFLHLFMGHKSDEDGEERDKDQETWDSEDVGPWRWWYFEDSVSPATSKRRCLVSQMMRVIINYNWSRSCCWKLWCLRRSMTKERKPAGKKAFLVQARKYLATLKRKEKKRKNLLLTCMSWLVCLDCLYLEISFKLFGLFKKERKKEEKSFADLYELIGVFGLSVLGQ